MELAIELEGDLSLVSLAAQFADEGDKFVEMPHEALAIDIGIHDHGFLDDEFAGFGVEPAPVTGGIAVAPPPARDSFAMPCRSRRIG
ncbi:MAG: hypothetical protein Q8O34_08020 [Rhodocyclaceae bacterium]|nr:hypothetical protein [Rhodocyclaceae bacterium]